MLYRFEGFAFDPAESRLMRGAETLTVQPKVLDALRLFVERPGRLLSKQELMDGLWPGLYVGEESLTQVIRKLRLALGDDPHAPSFVETVPRRGYRFLPTVVAGPEDTVEPLTPANVETAPPSRRERAARRLWLWAGAGVAVVLVVALIVRWPPAPAGEARAAAPAAELGGHWRLTSSPGRETYPAIAPDGSRYAFVLRAPGEADYDLYVAAIGGPPVRLTATAASEQVPQFSPDGRQIVFTRKSGDRSSVLRVSAMGGAPALAVDDGEEATWSADGLAILYAKREPGPVFVVRRRELATGNDRELWRARDPLTSLAASPDGKWVAAVAGERRILVGPARAAGEPRSLVGPLDYVRSVAWLPAADAVVTDARFPGRGGSLVRVPLGGGPPRALTAGSSGVFHPTVDRRGRVLYALEHKLRQIVRLDAQLRRSATLPLPTTIECFDVAPDGAQLAASDWSPPPGRGSLALLATDDGAAQPLGDGLCPAYAPDGTHLAYLGANEDAMGLWLLDLAAGTRRRVGPDRGKPGLIEENAARRPAWSPDGRQIAYVGAGLAEGSGVFVVEVATSRRRLVAPGVSGQLAWSPDGRRLAVSGDGPAEGLVVVDLRSRAVRRLQDHGNFRATPVWLDADRVAFLVDQQTQPASLVIDAASGRPLERRLIEVAEAPSFWGIYELIPDRRGGWLAIVETYESDLYMLAERPR